MSHYGYVSDGRAIPTCLRCGVLVTNQTVHDSHHEMTKALEELVTVTFTNLFGVMLALIGDDDEESTVVQ